MAGMLYVAFVIDAYARRIVGWREARTMNTTLVLDALEHAFFTRAREGVSDLPGLIAHIDAVSIHVRSVHPAPDPGRCRPLGRVHRSGRSRTS